MNSYSFITHGSMILLFSVWELSMLILHNSKRLRIRSKLILQRRNIAPDTRNRDSLWEPLEERIQVPGNVSNCNLFFAWFLFLAPLQMSLNLLPTSNQPLFPLHSGHHYTVFLCLLIKHICSLDNPFTLFYSPPLHLPSKSNQLVPEKLKIINKVKKKKSLVYV